jgi:hypothetical protein
MYLIGPTLEQKLRHYLAVFDGTKKDFSEFEHLFDALFHKEFCDTINFRQQDVSREHSKALHAEYLAMGTKATLVHYRRVGFSTIDVSYNLFNDQDEVVTRQLITRQNGRIVRTQQVSYRNVALNTEENDGVKQQFFNISGTECSASSYMMLRCKSSVYACLRMQSYVPQAAR